MQQSYFIGIITWKQIGFYIVSMPIVHYRVADNFFKMDICILSAISNIWLLLLLSLAAILPYHFILFYFTTCVFGSLFLSFERTTLFSPVQFLFSSFKHFEKYQIIVRNSRILDFSLFCSVTFRHINFTISLMRLIWWWVYTHTHALTFKRMQTRTQRVVCVCTFCKTTCHLEHICVNIVHATPYGMFRLFYHFALERFLVNNIWD